MYGGPGAKQPILLNEQDQCFALAWVLSEKDANVLNLRDGRIPTPTKRVSPCSLSWESQRTAMMDCIQTYESIEPHRASSHGASGGWVKPGHEDSLRSKPETAAPPSPSPETFSITSWLGPHLRCSKIAPRAEAARRRSLTSFQVFFCLFDTGRTGAS